jgi:hypothetical protein
MASVMHHTIHVPAFMSRSVHSLEKLLGAALLALLPPLAFALLIVSGLLLALGVSKIL